jgi:hypothetical protein
MVCVLYASKKLDSRLRGAVARAAVQRSDDPFVACSNPTVGHGCRSFGGDRTNRGPVSQWVWHVKEPSLLKAMSAKHRSKFGAPSSLGKK